MSKTIKAENINACLQCLRKDNSASIDAIDNLMSELDYNGESGTYLETTIDLLHKEIAKLTDDIKWWQENGDQEI